MAGQRITKHSDLKVFQESVATAMELFRLSRSFPREETYSLTDQMRRASRSVSANIAEAWRTRRYEKHFVSKLSDAEAEAAETQVWIHYAVECGYLDREEGQTLYRRVDHILSMLVSMAANASDWLLPSSQ